MCKRFTVECLKVVSPDHTTERWYVQDNLTTKAYDTMYENWAKSICDLLNYQEKRIDAIIQNLDNLEVSITQLLDKYRDDEIRYNVLKEVIDLKLEKEGIKK